MVIKRMQNAFYPMTSRGFLQAPPYRLQKGYIQFLHPLGI